MFNVNNYDRFYRKNKDRLFAYLLRMTGDYHVACDLVQESFTRYLKNYNRINSRTLLYTIARNAALDTIRKQKTELFRTGDYEDQGSNPESQVIERQAFNRILNAIGQLEMPNRELISLVANADLTYREIGRILNISEANVKVRVHRARMKLRTILDSGDE